MEIQSFLQFSSNKNDSLRTNVLNNYKCGDYYFSSNFDSGNLGKVELLSNCIETEISENIIHSEFNVWTTPDCFGTPNESPNRTWFFFSIRGGRPHRNVKINVKNLNRQSKLFSHGMSPVMRIGHHGTWQRIKDKPTFQNEIDNFAIGFIHRVMEKPDVDVFYAFTYPFTYTECQNMLERFDEKHGKTISEINGIIRRIDQLTAEEKSPQTTTGSNKKHIQIDIESSNRNDETKENKYDYLSRKDLQNEIYYDRELLINSLDGRRIDLLTISSFHYIQEVREKRLTNLFPDESTPRCQSFKDKKVIFLSSRVHPGETPASFVLNGFLSLLLDKKSVVAMALRRIYVFKIVPILNPDGVYRGFYRTDTLGQNLNRMYINTRLDIHPSIYAVKKIIKFYQFGIDSKEVSDLENNNSSSPETRESSMSLSSSEEQKINIIDLKKITEIKILKENEQISTDSDKDISPDPIPPSTSNSSTASDGETLITSDEKSSPGSFETEEEKGKVFTEKLIPEIKTAIGHLDPNITRKIIPQNFAKKVSEQKLIKKGAIKTILGTTHNTSIRSVEQKLKENASMQQRHLTKKSNPRKEFKGTGGNSSNLSKGMLFSQKSLKSSKMCSSNNNISATEYISGITPNSDACNLFLYIDMHGHASKKGVFMYGNHFSNVNQAVECMLLPRLMSINSQHFHYDACNFSEKNMYRREKRDGLSKEGSGRVAVYKITGLIKSYTLECNYNCGKYVNILPARGNNYTNKIINTTPPKYTPAIFEEVGRALGPSILDITNANNMSRIQNSDFRTLQGLRSTLRYDLERNTASHHRPTSSSNPNAKIPSVKRRSLVSLSAAHHQSPLTSNETAKENYTTTPWNQMIGVASCSSSSTIQQPQQSTSQAQHKLTRNLKKTTSFKIRSTNIYGKKDSPNLSKKKQKILVETSNSSSTKKDQSSGTFSNVPNKKVKVSIRSGNTHINTKDKHAGASTSFATTSAPLSVNNNSSTSTSSTNSSQPVGVSTKPSCYLLFGSNSDTTTPITHSSTNALTENETCFGKTLSNVGIQAKFLKKSTSESGLTAIYENSLYTSSSTSIGNALITTSSSPDHTIINNSSSENQAMVYNKTAMAESVASTSNKSKCLNTFQRTNSANDSVTFRQNNEISTKIIRNVFGGSENSKLKKKRIVRYDSIIVKRKKSKIKNSRY